MVTVRPPGVGDLLTLAWTPEYALIALATLVVPGAILAIEPTKARARDLVLDYWMVGVFAVFAAIGVWLYFSRDQEFFRVILDRYGLYILFAIFILEGAMLLYFAPSESLVPIAIATMADSTDDYVWIIGVAVAGATIGQYLLFLVAKRGGREYLLEKRWFRVSEDRLATFDRWFDKWGPIAVPATNSFLFTRGMLTVPAGFAEMDDKQFIVLSALGTLSFEILLAAGAFTLLNLA